MGTRPQRKSKGTTKSKTKAKRLSRLARMLPTSRGKPKRRKPMNKDKDEDDKKLKPAPAPKSSEPDPMGQPPGPSPAPNPESAPGGDVVGTPPEERKK
jgi:hypothetical protein